MRIQSRVAAAALATLLAVPSLAHIERSEPIQSLRQSYFALVGMTFGPMADMVKGKIDWDDATFQRWASDLAAVSTFQVGARLCTGLGAGQNPR